VNFNGASLARAALPFSMESKMDMRKFGSGFIKPDDVRDGPRLERIINVYESEKYGCPVLEFASGDQFSLNATNTKILSKAWGERRLDRLRA
jgi:hypothetical protein